MGDFIVQWNGQPVDNSGSLGLHVAKTPIGSKAKIVLYREGQKMTIEVPIEERPRQLNR